MAAENEIVYSTRLVSVVELRWGTETGVAAAVVVVGSIVIVVAGLVVVFVSSLLPLRLSRVVDAAILFFVRRDDVGRISEL